MDRHVNILESLQVLGEWANDISQLLCDVTNVADNLRVFFRQASQLLQGLCGLGQEVLGTRRKTLIEE